MQVLGINCKQDTRLGGSHDSTRAVKARPAPASRSARPRIFDYHATVEPRMIITSPSRLCRQTRCFGTYIHRLHCVSRGYEHRRKNFPHKRFQGWGIERVCLRLYYLRLLRIASIRKQACWAEDHDNSRARYNVMYNQVITLLRRPPSPPSGGYHQCQAHAGTGRSLAAPTRISYYPR